MISCKNKCEQFQAGTFPFLLDGNTLSVAVLLKIFRNIFTKLYQVKSFPAMLPYHSKWSNIILCTLSLGVIFINNKNGISSSIFFHPPIKCLFFLSPFDLILQPLPQSCYCQGLEISANGSENVTIYQAKWVCLQ